jgi:cytochrome P450
MVFGYEEVSQALNDGDTFNNGIMAQFYEHGFGNSINGMDAPDHPRYRKLFQKAFMPNVVSQWGRRWCPKSSTG